MKKSKIPQNISHKLYPRLFLSHKGEILLQKSYFFLLFFDWFNLLCGRERVLLLGVLKDPDNERKAVLSNITKRNCKTWSLNIVIFFIIDSIFKKFVTLRSIVDGVTKDFKECLINLIITN